MEGRSLVLAQATKALQGEGCTTNRLSPVWIQRCKIKWTGYSCLKMDLVWITATRMSLNSPQLAVVWTVAITRLRVSLLNVIWVNFLRKVLIIERGAGWSIKEQRRVSSKSAQVPKTVICKVTNLWSKQKAKTVWNINPQWIMLYRMIRTQSRLPQLLPLTNVLTNLIRTSSLKALTMTPTQFNLNIETSS